MFDPIAGFLSLLAGPLADVNTNPSLGSSLGLPGITIGLGS